LNDAVEDHLTRRALTPDEFARLIDATGAGPVRIRLTGGERVMRYLVAAYTGFRAGELWSVTPESFDLASDPPMLTIEASYSKRRRRDSQPLRADLVEMLRDYLRDKPRGCKVWGGGTVPKCCKLI
jgi:integrase